MIRKAVTACSFFLSIASSPVSGDLTGEFSLDTSTGYLHSAGHSFQLYGIRVIDRHRQCTANSIPWNCGEAAQLALLSYLDDESLVCILLSPANSRDTEFPEAECFLGARSINAQMVTEGWALTAIDILVPYRDESLVAQENEAGIFRGSFVPPDEWRPPPRTGLGECGVCAARHQSIAGTREKRKALLQKTGGNN